MILYMLKVKDYSVKYKILHLPRYSFQVFFSLFASKQEVTSLNDILKKRISKTFNKEKNTRDHLYFVEQLCTETVCHEWFI